MSGVEFKEWPKIPRGQEEIITITEKIDGTNACIVIQDGKLVGVQSRKRCITPEDDNYGFAKWVEENKADLLSLEDGYHYGEWAGPGIQKNPHNLEEKTFFLFNTNRWNPDNPNTPNCCSVVPVLYHGLRDRDVLDVVMANLSALAKKTCYLPEGVVVWYSKTRRYEKYTFAFTGGKWNG